MKKFLSALLAISVVLGGAAPTAVKPQDYVISASAAEEYTEGTYDVLKYKNYGDYIEISDCDEAADEVVIPSEIDGVPVTSIGDEAFQECTRLTSITIPDSVTSIGNSAFYWCNGLTSVTIPDSVTSIGNSAFYFCTSLTSVTIPDSVTSIGNNTFCDCWSLTSVNIPNSVISIGDYAFQNCSSLTSLTIPDSVISIGYLTFNSCSVLNSIFIPDSVTNIGEGAFSYCLGLTEILVDENNTYFTSDNGVLFNKNKTELYTYPAGKSEKEYTIPDSVTSILEDAFLFCSNLTSITIPDSVTSIYYTTFVGFTGTIYGYANSAAQTYAEENGYKFESLGAAPEKPKTGSGDIDGSGAVDASDASMVLADYATVATGGASTLSEAQRLAADVNGDNAVDSSDASTILAYYAYTATGGTDSLAEFMKK